MKEMKLICWNVNGVRAVAKKGFFEWLKKESPDILCLQETKASPDNLTNELLEPPGYQTLWGEKRLFRCGYFQQREAAKGTQEFRRTCVRYRRTNPDSRVSGIHAMQYLFSEREAG